MAAEPLVMIFFVCLCKQIANQIILDQCMLIFYQSRTQSTRSPQSVVGFPWRPNVDHGARGLWVRRD